MQEFSFNKSSLGKKNPFMAYTASVISTEQKNSICITKFNHLPRSQETPRQMVIELKAEKVCTDRQHADRRDLKFQLHRRNLLAFAK